MPRVQAGGARKKSRLINKREKEIFAYYETVHDLIAEYLPSTDLVHKISIVHWGIAALGFTLQLRTEDRYLVEQKKNKLVKEIIEGHELRTLTA